MFDRRLSSDSYSVKQTSKSPSYFKMQNSDSTCSPGISRYGRSHKPKMQDDYVSTDKKVTAILKLSPGNQMKYVREQQRQDKKASPKKTSPRAEGTPRRGRPPKSVTTSPAIEELMKPRIKVEPQDPSEPVDGCEWMVGDLAWARVGGHPFWPCIIAMDPQCNIFTKTIRKGRVSVNQRWVHVQFFGDNGRRSWLNTNAIMSYNGRDAFVQLGDTILAGMRRKEPKQTSAFVIKPAVIQVWEKAVQEAEDLNNSSRQERIAFFAKHFPLPQPQLTQEKVLEKLESAMSTSPTPPKKRGRKRKAEQYPDDENNKKQIKLDETPIKEEEPSPNGSNPLRTIADRKKRQALLMQLARSCQSPVISSGGASKTSSPSTPSTAENVQKEAAITQGSPQSATGASKATPLKRPLNEPAKSVESKKPRKKYVKKKVPADFSAFSSKNFDRVADDHPELNEKEINKYLQKLWNEMDETQKSRYRSRFEGTDKGVNKSIEESSEELEVSSEDNEEVRSSKSSSPLPLAVATQKPAGTKRAFRNLFTGVKAEKVCLICDKAGDTVRCKGPCQGFYHPACDTDHVPEPAVIAPATPKAKRGRPKKNTGTPQPSADASNSEEPTDKLADKDSNPQMNGVVSEKPKRKPIPDVEVVEPAGGKVRKSSKDSDSGSGSGSGEESEGFRCRDCQEGRPQPCFVCQEYVQKTTGEAKLYRCCISYCGKVYHEECLKSWPQCSWRTQGNGKSSDRGVVTCPQHTCHTCASDNPVNIKARYSNDKLVRCIRCPTTYHYGNYCVPAGSEILTNTQIICPRHYKPSKKAHTSHVNAAWCFICASGGSLICCDLCPTSFHASCLNIDIPPDGGFVCEDCVTGRFPLYGEIVWVKLGTYRWWPAEILYPAMIPDNILNLPHVRGEFAVKFFGSHDHYWVNRGRTFLYQDGDTAGKSSYKKSSVDHVFERAAREASEAQCRYQEEKATRDAGTRPGMKPPNYVKLKSNKPVGNVRAVELGPSSLTPCDCDPKNENPCAPESDCLNRILMVECHPAVCPAGEKCCNQLFEKRQYPLLTPFYTQERGWGLKTLVPLKKGDFVIEYVGEVIDEEEYKKRVAYMHEINEENFYFLTIDKDRMLDAGPKGNVSRFMNHSCQPNCETQKWTVNGDTRVGLFALDDIAADTELVFNYNLESTGNDKKPCMCGAPNCSGFIGVKAVKTVEKEEGKEKKVVKKKKSSIVAKTHEEECFICGEEGELLLCDGKYCLKGYHLACLSRKQRPQGYWLCPWHQCNVCNKGRVQRCSLCVNSYCQDHSEGNIALDDVKGLLCSQHSGGEVEDAKSLSSNTEQVENGIKPEPSSSKLSTTIGLVTEDHEKGKIASSQSPDDSAKKETVNNNIIKPENTPQRRSKRSRSNADNIVNGSIQSIKNRKGRPSSVDEKLIASYEKTDINSEKSPETKKQEAVSDCEELKDMLDKVIDNLLINESIESKTIKEDESTSVDACVKNLAEVSGDTNQSTNSETVKVPDVEDGDLGKQKSESEDETLGENARSNDLIGQLTEENKTTHIVDNVAIKSENSEDAPEIKYQLQENDNNEIADSSHEPQADSTEPIVQACENDENSSSEKETKTVSESVEINETVHTVSDVPVFNGIEDESKSQLDMDNAENCLSGLSDCKNDNSDKPEISITEKYTNSEIVGFTKDVIVPITVNSMDTEESMNSEGDSGFNTQETVNSVAEETTVNSVAEETTVNSDAEETTVNSIPDATDSKEVMPLNHNVDDFELCYSELSNDKISINNESSFEFKLTDCTNTENEEDSSNPEKLKSDIGIVKSVEQSNAMEVA